MEPTRSLTQPLQNLMVAIIFCLALVMFGAVFGQVIFRYVLKHPLPWSEELARYLMIWIACLAGSEAYRLKSHVGVNILVNALPQLAQTTLRRLVHGIVLMLMGVIIYHGYRLSWLLRDQSSPAMEIPMTWAYLAVPVGCTLMAIHALRGIFQPVTPPERGKP